MAKIIVTLNNKFYNRKSIEQASEDYKDICDCKIINNSFEVELTPKKTLSNMDKEFCNYVLGVMQNS